MRVGAVEAVAVLRAAHETFAACDYSSLSRVELLAVLDEFETVMCQVPASLSRLLVRLQAEATPRELGAKSWNEVLRVRWRLSSTEASRRLGEAAVLGPRRALTGEPLAPVLPVVAAAVGAGLINAEHVKVLRDAVERLPGFVDQGTRAQFEADLVRVAVGVGPRELKETAELRLFLLDQDGPEPDDTERARRRGVTMAKQGRDAMTALMATLTPEAAAVMEVLFARFAAPGMCNPDDEHPCTFGTPSQAQIDNDHRSLAQRQHDALLVIGRIALMSDLGQLNGLPVSVIIRTTLQDLESRAGIGVSGGGTKIPINEVIRMGAHANHHLAVFDRASGAALNYFRARRTASPAQRIMLIARDGGCTKPCCTVGAYGSQVHHAVADWADGGNTNVDEMALACGPHNRLVGDGGYSTTINDRGEVEWHPPPGLDHGQHRINYHHRPELLLTPPEDQPEPQDPKPDRAPVLKLDGEPDLEPDGAPDLKPDGGPDNEYAPEQDPKQEPQPAPGWDPAQDPEQDPDWNLAQGPAQDPEWNWQPDPGQDLEWHLAQDSERDWQPIPEGDAQPDREWDPQQGPEWVLAQDPEWDLMWETDTDTGTKRVTLTPPKVEHPWDTEPFDPQSLDYPEPFDPELFDPGPAPEWILLEQVPPEDHPPTTETHRDTNRYVPDPWQPTDDHALEGKSVRGP